jgi:hypothetical protein
LIWVRPLVQQSPHPPPVVEVVVDEVVVTTAVFDVEVVVTTTVLEVEVVVTMAVLDVEVVVPTAVVEVEVEVLVTVVDGPVAVVVVRTTVEVVVVAVLGHRQSSWHSRWMCPGPRAGHVRLQGGSHSSPGSIVSLPHSGGTVVVVVPITPVHGSGTQLPSPPMSVPPAVVHSLGFCGSQTNAPAGDDVGRQQLMSWGPWSGAQP